MPYTSLRGRRVSETPMGSDVRAPQSAGPEYLGVNSDGTLEYKDLVFSR